MASLQPRPQFGSALVKVRKEANYLQQWVYGRHLWKQNGCCREHWTNRLLFSEELVERFSEFVYINVIVARIGRDACYTLGIAVLGAPSFREIQCRFIRALPFTVTILSPLFGMLGRVKNHVRLIQLNKTHRRETGLRSIHAET
ncbi:hypothetical protein [Bradyrhizobium sp. UFLA03-84]|uniref:hypothetical protein n=1 Tax=Bradyrhizobium sp. UFLA03-84 TaxID=418599 RepID=UPI00130409CB|nr:hypothetical protein [Bradyrhizobium sp. UFLA03-84]